MDERKNLEREAEMARANLDDLAGELGERAKVGKRMKMAVVDKTKATGAFVVDKTKATGAYVKAHPVAMGIAGALIGLAAGALLPVGKRERGLLDKMQAKLQTKLDELTGMVGLDEDPDAEVSPDMDMTSLAGEEDALDRMEAADATDVDDDDDMDEAVSTPSTTSSDPYKMPS